MFDDGMTPGYGRIRTSYLGTPVAYSGTANRLTCNADQVAIIDEIRVAGHTDDAATNLTVTLEINDIELPFHLSGTANARRHEELVWKPKGNLIVHPSKFLRTKASSSNTAYLSGRYRLMNLQKAHALGYLSGGTLPNVASTNTLTGSGTSADTAKAIVTPVAGQYVEILGFTYTGHNFNAALDNLRLGFWDGTTGTTFTGGGVTIFRAYNRGVSGIYQGKILVGNTKGCIQGPAGYGVYIQATTNLAGSTPPADFNIIYRYRKSTDCANNTGASITTAGKKWWRYVDGLTLGTAVPFFSSLPVTAGCRIQGHAGSLTGTDQAANGGVGIGLGSDATALISEFYAINGDGNTGAAGRSWGVDDNVYVCSTAQAPGFVGADALSAITARSQLAWGTLDGNDINALPATGGGVNIRDTWTA